MKLQLRGIKTGRVFSLLLFSFFHMAAAFTIGAQVIYSEQSIYTPSEKKRLTSSKSPDDRIRVYDTAFERMRKEIEKDIREDRFDDASLTLSAWSALLKESRADIEANVNTKKKSGRLKQYEIHLRQAINELRALRAHAPVELYDAFISLADQAEETRRKFMDILFNLQ